jgi:hypothetical protein
VRARSGDAREVRRGFLQPVTDETADGVQQQPKVEPDRGGSARPEISKRYEASEVTDAASNRAARQDVAQEMHAQHDSRGPDAHGAEEKPWEQVGVEMGN